MKANLIFVLCLLLSGLTLQNNSVSEERELQAMILPPGMSLDKGPQNCQDVWSKEVTPQNQAEFYDLCKCGTKTNVAASIISKYSKRSCMIDNTAKDTVTGLTFCELSARKTSCTKITDVKCKLPDTKVNGRCTGPTKCKAFEK